MQPPTDTPFDDRPRSPDTTSSDEAEDNTRESESDVVTEDEADDYERFRDRFAGMGFMQPNVEPHKVDSGTFAKHHRLPPILRQVYTKALFNRMKGNSFKVTDHQLEQDIDLASLSSGRNLAEEYPDYYTERTRTALSHLGADPDDVLDTYITCPKCWKLTPLNQLYRSDLLPVCSKPRLNGSLCSGQLYTQRLKIRTPSEVVAYHPLSVSLSLLLQDPEIVAHLQDWRNGVEEGYNRCSGRSDSGSRLPVQRSRLRHVRLLARNGVAPSTGGYTSTGRPRNTRGYGAGGLWSGGHQTLQSEVRFKDGYQHRLVSE
ncbi:hypothetical protein QFC24_006870 [Naganishia onofrii]|uniref:Uncharacterized protein n=1 Tax=Naganishia onofrii TaxID=1851511 RepID=A0ACC2WVV7_9TREE|nr:hypothetical protein QFC24_006870 [Naganishia onofrii]